MGYWLEYEEVVSQFFYYNPKNKALFLTADKKKLIQNLNQFKKNELVWKKLTGLKLSEPKKKLNHNKYVLFTTAAYEATYKYRTPRHHTLLICYLKSLYRFYYLLD